MPVELRPNHDDWQQLLSDPTLYDDVPEQMVLIRAFPSAVLLWRFCFFFAPSLSLDLVRRTKTRARRPTGSSKRENVRLCIIHTNSIVLYRLNTGTSRDLGFSASVDRERYPVGELLGDKNVGDAL